MGTHGFRRGQKSSFFTNTQGVLTRGERHGLRILSKNLSEYSFLYFLRVFSDSNTKPTLGYSHPLTSALTLKCHQISWHWHVKDNRVVVKMEDPDGLGLNLGSTRKWLRLWADCATPWPRFLICKMKIIRWPFFFFFLVTACTLLHMQPCHICQLLPPFSKVSSCDQSP